MLINILMALARVPPRFRISDQIQGSVTRDKGTDDADVRDRGHRYVAIRSSSSRVVPEGKGESRGSCRKGMYHHYVGMS